MAKEIEAKVEPVDVDKVAEVVTSKLPKFTKSQLVTSRKYIHRRDALNALLKDSEQYTFAQVDKILKQFDEGVKN
ncbi:hypothetical protein LZ480_07730 [Solibacillus sp. MA9]|uniref:Uncharacterized protein n=1 Tax=Solibacillus palustris TaxID=2908203 RepID=A0ABS9UBQ5_9BACL|nr:hypothetical protein [Solibacillus sp. MA9]MCH7321782.1 hypothetical protein [Solibacillus sp. MA9]